MIYVFATISVLINIVFIFYLRGLLKKFIYLSENIDDLFYSLDSYSQHLGALYEMETYYGDESLEKLIQHSKNVLEIVQNFKDIYTLEEETVQDGEEEEE